ncbi:putative UDP-glucuronate 4-epimerase [Helianthus annuus]|nr:putative UDP-glucuronate 4-epimerase [Helianthus annuus]
MSLWNGSSLIKRLNQELFVCIGIQMGKTVKSSVNIRSKTGYSVLVIGAAGFVRTHISAALKRLRFRWDFYCGRGHGNIGGFVNILEVGKNANPQPAIVWASSRSVRKRPNRSTPPASLYAAKKKAGEEISHTYNHIYGFLLTGLRFFTVYGPWGRPDMAYFFFTKDILKGKPIPIFKSSNHGIVVRDFTNIDDIVRVVQVR